MEGGCAWRGVVHGRGGMHVGDMATEAGATHTTGMHTCRSFFNQSGTIPVTHYQCQTVLNKLHPCILCNCLPVVAALRCF